MHWQDNNSSSWGSALMIISMVLLWALLAVGLALVVRYLRRATPSPTRSRSNAEDLLAERYARGEIDETEYRARLDTLKKYASH